MINSDVNGQLRIFSESGLLVNSCLTYPGESKITWVPEGLAAGTYIVALDQENSSAPEIRKAVYLP
jgi:hypothetical protein